jgi:muramoyltetrapeptide carboxypeptidase
MSVNKIQPAYLKEGDVVAIISPSYSIEAQNIDDAVKKLSSWGLKVITGRNALNKSGPFAGTDEQRLSDLQQAVDDPSIKAVLCSRGGYGASRIIDRVDFSSLKEHPRWFAGFSDITVFHLWLNKVIGMESIHSDMPLHFGTMEGEGAALSTLRDALFGNLKEVVWDGQIHRPAKVEGEVTGGNLSILYGLTGTPAEPDTEGKILVIEETGEYYYHIDRMLVSLRLAGKLDRLAALVVGGMADISDSASPWGKNIEDTVIDVVKDKDYPVLFGFPAGHIIDNRAFYMGRKAKAGIKDGRLSLVYC